MSDSHINKKLRSEYEIRDYLTKKEISKENIDETIKRLKENNFINESIYLKSYINDQINLTNNGPRKIEKNLIKLGLKEEDIKEKLEQISIDTWESRIDKYVSKKIKTNHKSSKNMLKMKIINELINFLLIICLLIEGTSNGL